MDFGKVLSNPVVLGGGALLGIILLLKSPSAAAASQSSGYSPAYLSYSMQLNTAALGAQVENAQTAADLEKARFSRDLGMQSQTLSYLKNVGDNQTTLAVAGINSRAGITNAMISSSTMLALDIQGNTNRLALAQQETKRAQITADASVDVARYQYKGQKQAAKANIIGNVLGAATKVASFI